MLLEVHTCPRHLVTKTDMLRCHDVSLAQSSANFCQTVHTTLRAASTERLASFIVPDVERIAKGFESQVRFLFKVLNGARLQQSAPHLARLLLRLDFSGYYSG